MQNGQQHEQSNVANTQANQGIERASQVPLKTRENNDNNQSNNDQVDSTSSISYQSQEYTTRAQELPVFAEASLIDPQNIFHPPIDYYIFQSQSVRATGKRNLLIEEGNQLRIKERYQETEVPHHRQFEYEASRFNYFNKEGDQVISDPSILVNSDPECTERNILPNYNRELLSAVAQAPSSIQNPLPSGPSLVTQHQQNRYYMQNKMGGGGGIPCNQVTDDDYNSDYNGQAPATAAHLQSPSNTFLNNNNPQACSQMSKAKGVGRIHRQGTTSATDNVNGLKNSGYGNNNDATGGGQIYNLQPIKKPTLKQQQYYDEASSDNNQGNANAGVQHFRKREDAYKQTQEDAVIQPVPSQTYGAQTSLGQRSPMRFNQQITGGPIGLGQNLFTLNGTLNPQATPPHRLTLQHSHSPQINNNVGGAAPPSKNKATPYSIQTLVSKGGGVATAPAEYLNNLQGGGGRGGDWRGTVGRVVDERECFAIDEEDEEQHREEGHKDPFQMSLQRKADNNQMSKNAIDTCDDQRTSQHYVVFKGQSGIATFTRHNTIHNQIISSNVEGNGTHEALLMGTAAQGSNWGSKLVPAKISKKRTITFQNSNNKNNINLVELEELNNGPDNTHSNDQTFIVGLCGGDQEIQLRTAQWQEGIGANNIGGAAESNRLTYKQQMGQRADNEQLQLYKMVDVKKKGGGGDGHLRLLPLKKDSREESSRLMGDADYAQYQQDSQNYVEDEEEDYHENEQDETTGKMIISPDDINLTYQMHTAPDAPLHDKKSFSSGLSKFLPSQLHHHAQQFTPGLRGHSAADARVSPNLQQITRKNKMEGYNEQEAQLPPTKRLRQYHAINSDMHATSNLLNRELFDYSTNNQTSGNISPAAGVTRAQAQRVNMKKSKFSQQKLAYGKNNINNSGQSSNRGLLDEEQSPADLLPRKNQQRGTMDHEELSMSELFKEHPRGLLAQKGISNIYVGGKTTDDPTLMKKLKRGVTFLHAQPEQLEKMKSFTDTLPGPLSEFQGGVQSYPAHGGQISSNNLKVPPTATASQQFLLPEAPINDNSSEANNGGGGGGTDQASERTITEMQDKAKTIQSQKQVCKEKKRWLLYPDNSFRKFWDIVITTLIMATCLITPYNMAFPESYSDNLFYLDVGMNCIFFIDIIVNFFSAYVDVDFNLQDEHKKIAMNYLSTWFVVDFTSVIPLDYFLEYGNMSKIVRFSRIGKIYKLIKVTKMVNLVQTAKMRSKSAFVNGLLKIGEGLERILILLITSLILQHVCACIWVFIGRLNDTEDNWITQKNFTDFSDLDLYICSIYFTVTTIMTVGYGDISAYNSTERAFCILLMLIGVISFSFMTGALSSIISSYDSKEAQLKEKMSMLNDLTTEYDLDNDFHNELIKIVQYNHRKKQKDLLSFMEELPHKIKLELAMQLHKKLYSSIKFFNDKDKSFIAWICVLLKPLNIEDSKSIYKEGEIVTEIYFLAKGTAGYVLPRFNNKVYYFIEEGQTFGQIDLASDKHFIEEGSTFIKKNQQEAEYVRRFTASAFGNIELICLGLADLLQMKIEFPKIFKEIFLGSREELRKLLILKLEVIKHSEITSINGAGAKDRMTVFKARFAQHFMGELLKEMNTEGFARTLVHTIGDKNNMQAFNERIFQHANALNQQRIKQLGTEGGEGRKKSQAHHNNRLNQSTGSPHRHCDFCRSYFGPGGCEDIYRAESGLTISSLNDEEDDIGPNSISNNLRNLFKKNLPTRQGTKDHIQQQNNLQSNNNIDSRISFLSYDYTNGPISPANVGQTLSGGFHQEPTYEHHQNQDMLNKIMESLDKCYDVVKDLQSKQKQDRDTIRKLSNKSIKRGNRGCNRR